MRLVTSSGMRSYDRKCFVNFASFIVQMKIAIILFQPILAKYEMKLLIRSISQLALLCVA